MNTNHLACILLVEDSTELAYVYLEYLKKHNYTVNHVSTGEAAINFMQNSSPDVVLLDYVLPDMTGQTILEYINTSNHQCQVIVMTAHASLDTAITCIRLKTFDFLTKPFDANTLLKTVNNAISHQLQSKPPSTNNSLSNVHSHGFIGTSPPMQHVYRMIENSAASIATVFISGESGTGKEVCARALHNQSPRKDKPFIALNCAAIPHNLIESEIFGHIKGSFSGATSDRKGAATLADKGTLFLDEICEMDLDLQTKLLRFVQTGTFQKVGSSKLDTVDIRFVCATNRDVLLEVDQKRFREDLYYRLYVIPIEMPALRERGLDIIAIAEYFLIEYSKEENKRFLGFSEECELFLSTYGWPGNVRQLQNVIRNIVVLNNNEFVTIDMLPKLSASEAKPDSNNIDLEHAIEPEQINTIQNTTQPISPLWETEKNTIEHTITLCKGNIPRAAALLEISPSTIYRKKESWKQLPADKTETDQ
jgi:DNA-binding NtrC family response regulator